MLEESLEELEYAELIRRILGLTEIEYWFKHGLVQETTYEALLKQDRRRLHRFVAESLEAVGAPDMLAPLLAQHWDSAGEMERALPYYLRTGRNAARVYARTEALMAFDRARELASEVEVSQAQVLELYGERGRVLELSNRFDEALTNYQELEQAGARRGDARLALEGLVQHAKIHSTPNDLLDLAHAQALALQALETARELNDRPAIALVLWNLLLINHFAGRPEQAIVYGEAALEIARELNLRERLAYTLNDIARPYTFTGQIAKARAASDEAEKLWRELHDLPMLADNLTIAATYDFFNGDYETSIARGQEALLVSEQSSNMWGQAFASSILGMMFYTRGELAKAVELLLHGAELGKQAHFTDAVGNGYAFTALIYRLLGARERAIEMVERGLATPGSAQSSASGMYAVLTMLLTEQGELGKAHHALEAAQATFDGNADSPAPGLLGFGAVTLALAEKRTDEAKATALGLLSQLESHGIRPFLPMARVVLARALEQSGDLRGAIETLERARTEALELQARPMEWEVLIELVRLADTPGERGVARELHRDALETTRYLAEHAPPDLRESFMNRPEVRAIFASEPAAQA